MPKGAHYERMPIIDERADYSMYLPKCNDTTYESGAKITFRHILEDKPLERFSYANKDQIHRIIKQKEYRPIDVNPRRYLDQHNRTISEFASYFPSQYGVDNASLKVKSQRNRILQQRKHLYTSVDRINLHILASNCENQSPPFAFKQ